MLKITLDKSIKHKVKYTDIHGKFPYKKYLEIMGTSKFGKFIVVVSEEPIEDDCNTVFIKNESKALSSVEQTINRRYIQLRTKETDIFTVDNNKMLVFKIIPKEE